MKASTYLRNVKYMFSDDEEKYKNFLSVMMDFRAQRIDVFALRQRVTELFRGHKDLLLGFNFFLPENYEITLEDAQPPQIKKEATRDEALAYVNSVKDTLRDEMGKYEQFMDIMHDYGNERIDAVSVSERMKELLKGHRDLLLGFNVFLPKECEITLSSENEQPQKGKNLVDHLEN